MITINPITVMKNNYTAVSDNATAKMTSEKTTLAKTTSANLGLRHIIRRAKK